jgi:hypothetical protein
LKTLLLSVAVLVFASSATYAADLGPEAIQGSMDSYKNNKLRFTETTKVRRSLSHGFSKR